MKDKNMNKDFINTLGIELLEQSKQDPKLTLIQLSEVDDTLYFNTAIYFRYLLKAETKTSSSHTMQVKVNLYSYYDTGGFEVIISTLVPKRNAYQRAKFTEEYCKDNELIQIIAKDIIAHLHNLVLLYSTQT